MNNNSEDFDMASEDPERRIEFKHKRLENSVAKLLGHLQHGDDEKSHVNLAPSDPIGAAPSMTDLLEDLQERNGVTFGASSKVHHSQLIKNLELERGKVIFLGREQLFVWEQGLLILKIPLNIQEMEFLVWMRIHTKEECFCLLSLYMKLHVTFAISQGRGDATTGSHDDIRT